MDDPQNRRALYNSGLAPDVHECHCTLRSFALWHCLIHVCFLFQRKNIALPLAFFQVWVRWSIIREMRNRPGKGEESKEVEEEKKGLPVMLVHVFGTNTTRPATYVVLFSFVQIKYTQKRHLLKKEKNGVMGKIPQICERCIHGSTSNGTEIENREGISSCRAA